MCEKNTRFRKNNVSKCAIAKCHFNDKLTKKNNYKLMPKTHTHTHTHVHKIGRFNFAKQGNHVHTNMAKAALNMLTRTTGESLAMQNNIFMVSADTGWVTDELPLKRRVFKNVSAKTQLNNENESDSDSDNNRDNDSNDNQCQNENQENTKNIKTNNVKASDYIFHPPLDEIDGAARVLQPVMCCLIFFFF